MNRQSLDACYQKGRQILTTNGDRELAISLFARCVEFDPAQLAYLEAFLDTVGAQQGRKRRSYKFGPRRSLRKALKREDWREVFLLGVRRLTFNAWHVPTLLCLADACQNLHYNEVELRYLKQSLDADPHSERVNARCAEALARMGQFDQAIACWKRLESSRRYHDLAAEKMYELTLAKRNAARNQEVASLDASIEVSEPSVSEDEQLVEIGLEPCAVDVQWELNRRIVHSHESDGPDDDGSDSETRGAEPRESYWPSMLESALVLVAISLLLQLFPGVLKMLGDNIHVTAFAVNFFVVVGLILFRQRQLKK